MIYIVITILLLAAWGYFLYIKRPAPATKREDTNTISIQTESQPDTEAAGSGKASDEQAIK